MQVPTAQQIEQLLRKDYGYSAHGAAVTARDLLHFSSAFHGDLDAAVAAWVRDRASAPVVSSGRFSTDSLADLGLGYPAALVFIDWHRSDPATAERALLARR